MKYKLVIFDFDGTLADTFPWLMSIVDKLAEKFKFSSLQTSEMDVLRKFDARQIFEHHHVPRWKLPMIAQHVRQLMAEEIHRISLFAGVDQILQSLAGQGVELAVVTSNSYPNVLQVLGAQNSALITHFECGVSIFGKTAKLKKVLRKSNISPADTLCIGDEIRDICAANRLKIPFGAVSWGYTSLEALQAHSPGEVYTSVDDMMRKIL